MEIWTGIAKAQAALRRLIFPNMPVSIQSIFNQAQFDRVLRYVPMIYAIAILNMGIIITACAHSGLPIRDYGWMPLLVMLAAFRMIVWLRRGKTPPASIVASRMVASMTLISVSAMASISAWTVWAYGTGQLGDSILIPISLTLGATCVAHCLAPLRAAAIGSLLVTVVPIASVMITLGDFEARLLGICMLSIAALMIRFVAEQYDQLVSSLMLEQKIRDQANTDALTGLANRRAIMDALNVELASGRPFGVALLDLDGFKAVNDKFGHHAGDDLLCHVAERLKGAARASDAVGRLGGDEFIVLFRNILFDEEVPARATALLAGLCRPAEVAGAQVAVAASLGHAHFPKDGATVTDLLIKADHALYTVKRQGKLRRPDRARAAA